MDLLSLVVVETESGAEVRLRDSEEPGEAYASLREALDSLLTDGEFSPKAGILRDESGETNGVWRWLDATAEEAEPASDGSQVTRELIATMASKLNKGSPAPMDGGTSAAHAQLGATETRSDGYAHVGVEVRDRSGRWHLFVRVELEPSVARDTDSGRLAYGSIGFTSDGRLLQHALTNVPAVEGLRPNNSVRGAPRGVRISFRSMRISMPTSPTKNAAKRATLADAEPMLLEMTGASPEELGTALVEIVAAHKAKMAEHAAEAEAEKPAEEASAADATARTDVPVTPPAPDAPRAEGAFPDAAAMELFASEMLQLAREVLGKPDASAAEVSDLMKASKAAFAGAIGQGAPPADAAAMSAPADAARTAALEASKRALDENVKLKADIARRDLRDAIGKRAVVAKATLSDTQLDELVADALLLTDAAARERCIVRGLRAAQSVPSGEVLGAGSATPTPTSISAARAALEPSVRSEFPTYGDNEIRATALRRAEARWPQLFNESTAR